jgi:hypothetical protein
MPFTPEKWGPASTSKDYEFFMEGSTPTSKLISLLGHALTSPSQELSDPVTVPEAKKVNGQIQVFQRTVRPSKQTSLSYTLLFPSSLWTPALERARRQNGCETDFYALRLCTDAEFDHAYIYPDAQLDPPVEVNDFITLEDDTIVTEQTTLRVQERLILWGLRADVVYTDPDDTPFYAVGFSNPDCIGCDNDLYTDAFVAGGDGTLADVAGSTEDRFSSVDAIDLGIPVGSLATSMYVSGSVVLVGFADVAAPATAVTGGTSISVNSGANFSLDTNLTAPVWGVGFFSGQYLAIGGTGAGAPQMWTSDNGIEWTAVSASALAGTDTLTALAIDEEEGNFYVVGEGGSLYKGSFTGGTVSVADISANLPGAPGLLRSVAVVNGDRVIVGGATGYAAESFDGGATFSTVAVSGSAVVGAVAGNQYRQIYGIGDVLYERSILTKYDLSEIELENSAAFTGDITAIVTPAASAYNSFNYFLVTTDSGQVIFVKPRYPNA